MTVNSFDWDEELAPETEEEVYRALLLALRRKQGFGLFFVQCTKAQGETIVADLRRDLSQQKIEELHLQGEVVTLYDQIAALWNQQHFDVLAIEGLQASLYAYEDTKRFSGWSSEDLYHYSWKGVPQILNHLNQQREHLRNDFPVRLVFLVPAFVVDYFIQRAADFLDWRSGLFRFPADPEANDVERFTVEGHTEYLNLTSEERTAKILELKSLQESCSDAEKKTKLLLELGKLFRAGQDYRNAIISYDKALEFKPDKHEAWYSRKSKPSALRRKKDAIELSWLRFSVSSSALGGREEAIKSYDKALEFKPDKHEAWYSKACCCALHKQTDLAIASLQEAIALDSKYREIAKTDADFDLIRQDDRFQALLNPD